MLTSTGSNNIYIFKISESLEMYCTVQWTLYVCKDHPRDQYKVAPKDRWDLYIRRCFTVVEWM